MKEVAEFLGNTPALARSSYVDPRVVDAYEEGNTIAAAVRRKAATPARAADHPRAGGAPAAQGGVRLTPGGARPSWPGVHLGEPGPAHVVLRRVGVLVVLQPGLGRRPAQAPVAGLADADVEQRALRAAVAPRGQGRGAEQGDRLGLGDDQHPGDADQGRRRPTRRTSPSRRRRTGHRRTSPRPRRLLEPEAGGHDPDEVRAVLGGEPGDREVGLDRPRLGRPEALDEHGARGEALPSGESAQSSGATRGWSSSASAGTPSSRPRSTTPATTSSVTGSQKPERLVPVAPHRVARRRRCARRPPAAWLLMPSCSRTSGVWSSTIRRIAAASVRSARSDHSGFGLMTAPSRTGGMSAILLGDHGHGADRGPRATSPSRTSTRS